MHFHLTRGTPSLPARPSRLVGRAAAAAALVWTTSAWAQSATQPAPGAVVAATPATAASASSEATGDPVARFLLDKGLIEPVASGAKDMARQMRDKAGDMASDLVLSAMNFLGVPYRRGGQSAESGFDCSGFTRYIFENSVGLVLPRRAEEQARAPGLLVIPRDELKPGDLVFFNTLRHTFSHVGIYVGDDKFIHSPRAGGEVRIEDMRLAYWTQRFNGARRVTQPAKSGVATASTEAPSVR
ncbi:C40 family peptidase [Aquabacterium sp.]|uniref:C40 family peptidase n=1 Tax=Aquabacterium sp. TaxID=1872578 RepID=UPI0035B4A8BD